MLNIKFKYDIVVVGLQPWTTSLGSNSIDLAKELSLEDVVFGGFINQTELPRVFSVSDIFVLPAENEPWGLIVNEAMCAGIPIVISQEVGCVPDLVKDGENGYHTVTADVGSLATAIEKLLTDGDRRRRMGASSLNLIKNWSYEQCRQGILTAFQKSIKSS